MKEKYLSDAFTERMTEVYLSKRRMAMLDNYKPVDFAVLGIDLQDYFLQREGKAYLPSTPKFLPRLLKFYTLARKIGMKIILTRHTHENNILAEWWNDRMVGAETEIHKSIIEFGDYIVEKHTYDSFLGTNLDSLLRDMKVMGVIITGVMTHLCCETTARSAFNRGYFVLFPVDGTITQNAKFHECTIRAISHGFALTPSLEMIEKWMQKWA